MKIQDKLNNELIGSAYEHVLYPGEEVLWEAISSKTKKIKRLPIILKGIALIVVSIAIPIPICDMFEPFSAVRLVLALTVLSGFTIGMFMITVGALISMPKYVLTSYRLLCLDRDLNVNSRRSFNLKHISSVTEKETHLRIEFQPPEAINSPFVTFSRSINGYDILKKHFYDLQEA